MKKLLTICAAALCFCANAATQLTLNDGDTLSGVYEDYEITIAAGATVTFNGATVTHTSGDGRAAIDCAGNATIVLAEGSVNGVTNTVNNCAAIHPANNATLTIRGSGSLDAYSRGNYGAGIGAASANSNSNPYPCGNIVIEGGTIIAHGGYCGAGVGAASWSAPCGNITITGDAVVTAVNGQWAACIGAASDDSPCGNITISGNASVTALQGDNQYAAGIGAGYDPCGSIVIDTTGTVNADGSRSAGIGSGPEYTGTCGDITILNGTITVTGGNSGCGIGATTSAECGDILISGGTIIAKGNDYGAGIGTLGESRSITITGGNVTATGSRNSIRDGGAGIGSMQNKTCGNIVISGGTVTATGGAWAAGIGSGHCGTCSNITISAGIVTANVCTSTSDSSTDAAAIGAGCRGACGDILISGGTVIADATNPQSTTYDYNSAIGATYNGTCGDITITDGITSVTATKGATAQQQIGQGNGSATIGTITYGSHLKQTLSNSDLTVTVEPNWVEIGNVTQLKAVANDLSGFYRLTADIDLANESWRLGTFTGIFDGNGHTIRNINCNNDWDNSGFFFALGDGAVVRNLSLRGGKVTTVNGYIGGLAGRVSGNVLIEDCTIDVLVSGGGYVGGFVGYVSNATLTLRRCRSLSAVVGGGDCVGGFVAYPYGSAVVTVEDCYAAGSVKGSSWVGGIVGCPDGGGNSLLTISNSYSVAELTGNFGSADERVGELNSRVVIIGTPTILDNFPTNIVTVRTRGTGTGTASYNAETGEFTATPSAGSAFYGWEGLPPKEGDYNETTVWAVFGLPVATASDFNNMDAGGIYVQTADIDLAGESGAIGYDGVFTGCYNGGNHEIRNMVKNGGYYSHGGLFSQMEGAVVKNLRIVDANVTGGDGTGALAGYAVKSTIENVRVEGGSVKGSGNNIGGLVGQAASGLFVECMSSATVEGNEALGGLVGHGGGSITVRRSYATGDVTGSRYAGGFIGNGDYMNFTDCYALGAVTATNSGYYAGGFIAGGVGVWNAYFAFTNCYSAGAVSGEANSGGFDSSERYSQRGCTNCYWDAEASGKNSSYVSGVTGLTTAQMKSGVAFEGWDTDVWKFAQGQYPRLRAFITKCTVTWLDADGSSLGDEIVDSGDTPVYGGATPTKAATAQYTYTFAGWTPAVTPVESNTTYTATYDATVNEYEITWLSDDDSVIDTTSVAYGDTPALATPTKAATAQYTYEFAGWTPAVVAVTGTATYKATFTPVLRSYTVTWKDDDGTTLGTDTVAYGSTPSRADPSKAATAQYTYMFTGWSPAVAAVTGDATYTATYSQTVNTYTITWLDYDGSTIKTETLAYGATPTCATPSRADDTYSTYTFLEWMPAVASVTGEATYTATYMMHSKWTGQGTVYEPYTLTTPERISEILALDEGSTPEIFVQTGGDVTSESISAQLPTGYAVRTTGTPGVVKVVQTVTVVWYDDDGETVLERDEDVDIGSMPSYDGVTPTKASTAQYTYEFTGWTPTIVAVTGSASYTATYAETLRSYTITWLDADGTQIGTSTVAYGSTPSHAAPASAYTFTGWTPSVASVTGDATYTATFSSEVQLANLTGDYTAADGDVLTGATTHNVTIPGGATVTVNGVSITGAGGGAVNPSPTFSAGGKAATTEFTQGANGQWTLTTFAELANDALGADVANEQIKVYRADTVAELNSASPMASGVEVQEKKSAVMTTIKVTPPTGAQKQFFKVTFGE
jgi:hypothetical protein